MKDNQTNQEAGKQLDVLEVLKRVRQAIESSNMKGTILHDEVKWVIKNWQSTQPAAATPRDDVISKEEILADKFTHPKDHYWYRRVLEAMEEYASQFAAPQVKWVQASERLPTIDRKYFVKHLPEGLPMLLWLNQIKEKPSLFEWLDEGSTDKKE